MKSGSLVRVQKLSTQTEGVLVDGYWAEGRLARDLEIGLPMEVLRHCRAPQSENELERNIIRGVFTSSPIMNIIELPNETVEVVTQNSHWLLSPL